MEHGGDDPFGYTAETKNHALDKVKTKNKNVFSNCELNTFDKIIERDVERNNLVDDISLPEGARDRKQGKSKQHPTQQSKPTPVTLANVWGSKKDRKIKFDNLRILLDSGCSDSIAQMKYGRKNRKKESTKKFATGSGQLKTKFQADIKFTLPELSNSKIINWNFRLTDNEDLGYDMILGRDIMTIRNRPLF